MEQSREAVIRAGEAHCNVSTIQLFVTRRNNQHAAEMEQPIRPSIEAPTAPSQAQIMSGRRRAAQQHFHWRNNAENGMSVERARRFGPV